MQPTARGKIADLLRAPDALQEHRLQQEGRQLERKVSKGGICKNNAHLKLIGGIVAEWGGEA